MLDVTVLLLDGSFASTAIGPIEVFHSAGLLWQQLRGEPASPRFRVTIASLDGGSIAAPYALGLSPQVSIRDVKRADLVIVPSSGLDFDAHLARHAALFPWLRRRAAQGALVAGVCTGAAYLAEAGLLDGREATSHWSVADEFRRRYPQVAWHPERLITEDRRMLCSGGVTSSFDLSLYLVEKFCGHEVALQTAKALLVNMPRASQSGYAVLPLSRPHGDDRIRTAEAYIEKHYRRDISIERLARLAHMSPRNFIRRFKGATGRLPGSYLQAVRVAVAKEMLEGGARSVQAVSTAVGYADQAFFREVFRRGTGMTPTGYRQAFAGVTSLSAGSPGARGFLKMPAYANNNARPDVSERVPRGLAKRLEQVP
jgi:transcriptional regulator GlxA family with amidase domain